MKKLLLLVLITFTTLSADVELKDGNYSWFIGDSQAFITIEKEKGNLYHIAGECIYGMGRKLGPNIGTLNFSATLVNEKIIYRDKEDGNYTFILSLNKDGSFNVDEKGNLPFGYKAYFYGHFTSDDLPSFDCKKTKILIEDAICNNIEIAQLDKKMARYYATYQRAFYFEKNKETLEKKLEQEQKVWIKNRNACVSKKSYKSCLINSYKQRIEMIKTFW